MLVIQGQTTDERGNAKPVAIMKHRINGQYIMEGLAASFMFSLGGKLFFIFNFLVVIRIFSSNRIKIFVFQ